MLIKVLEFLVDASPRWKKGLWRTWYEILSKRYKRADWTLMNYGYSSDRAARLNLRPEDEADRYYIQLYDRAASGGKIDGADVLEVGSGRGGGASYIARYLNPRSMLGVDYSRSAAGLCARIHSVPGLSFKQGDAESLPCGDESFDIVLNVESSHCYGSMEGFIREAFRVLRPGGKFLWADFRVSDLIEPTVDLFSTAGFEMGDRENITPDVIRALDLAHDSKKSLIRSHVPRFLTNPFSDFAALPGTRIYNAFREEKLIYLCCTFQKPK